MVDRVQGGSPNLGMSPYTKSQPLTEEQKSEAQSILSKYDPAKLTQSDAKAIFDAFREAKLPPGSELRDIMKAAGFNPAQLRAQATRHGERGYPVQTQPEPQPPVSTSTIDIRA